MKRKERVGCQDLQTGETDSCLLFAQYNETSRPLNIYHHHQPSLFLYSSTSFVNVSKEEDGAQDLVCQGEKKNLNPPKKVEKERISDNKTQNKNDWI